MIPQININVAKQFSTEPYGRLPEHGKNSGARFRQEFLLPAMQKADKVFVELDGADGYGSSFLEESFGGLIRYGYFEKDAVKSKLTVHHSLKNNVDRVWAYVDAAEFGASKDRAGIFEKLFSPKV